MSEAALARKSAEAAKKIGMMSGAAAEARQGFSEVGKSIFGITALFASFMKTIQMLNERSKKYGESMKDMEESSRSFAKIMGRSTWAEKLAASEAELARWTQKYEEMGGRSYSKAWYRNDAWDWIKRAFGAGSDKMFDQIVENMEASKDAISLISQYVDETSARTQRMSFEDLGRQIQKGVIGDANEAVKIQGKMLTELIKINARISNPMVTK